MKLTCPRCGTIIETGAAPPGTAIACSCGNVVQVPKKKSQVLWIVLGIVAVMGCLPCAGILAAIAIPNFIRFQARAKQAECRTQLQRWVTLQRSYFAENDEYALD